MKKMKWIIGAAVVLLIILIGILVIRKTADSRVVYEYTSGTKEKLDPNTILNGQNEVRLTTLTETEEEAQEIADLYQIELVSYYKGLAVYKTDKNPEEVIRMGVENGYPPISIDQENHAMDNTVETE
ncbi:MAG: hypothetical protein PUB13_09790 [Lachnospiraceae bacterium]|nr:hypothetical protein [Lachnospiraceae bacterium]